MAEPTNHELAKGTAVLEERMKTLQSGLQGTLEHFRTDMVAGFAFLALAGIPAKQTPATATGQRRQVQLLPSRSP